MNNLQSFWRTRFFHYMEEFQKYMRYVFTGHLAIVLVFTIGAGGYAYSEWLKEVPAHFPSSVLVAVIIGAAVAYSPPVTLLKPADAVYLLPLETQLDRYLSRALRWTMFSQVGLPLLLFIVAIPLLSATGTTSGLVLFWLAVFIVVFKWMFVQTEYDVRHAMSGEKVWLDRFVRFLLMALFIYIMLSPAKYLIVVISILIGIYSMYWKKMRSEKPFPYEHFVELEQNRMMRFYRFANYFTNVPHLKGSVSRRAWLSFLMSPPKMGQSDAQTFLIRRTFIRTDDTFWLWVRLTVISMVGAIFIPFPIVVFIFAGALAFASAVQLIFALRAGYEFRMDMLFPEKENRRPLAIRKTVRLVQWIQALVVAIAALFLYGISTTPILVGAIVLIVSEATIRLTGEKKE